MKIKMNINNISFMLAIVLGLIGLALITSANNTPVSTSSSTTITTTTSSSTTSTSTTTVRYPLIYYYADNVTIFNVTHFKVLDGHTFKIVEAQTLKNWTRRFDYGNVINEPLDGLINRPYDIGVIEGNYINTFFMKVQVSCKIVSISDINLTSGEAKLITNQTIIDAVSYGENCNGG